MHRYFLFLQIKKCTNSYNYHDYWLKIIRYFSLKTICFMKKKKKIKIKGLIVERIVRNVNANAPKIINYNQKNV